MHAALLFLLGADAILGTWRGESICVKADWNAACNDEQVELAFVPAKAAGTITGHARQLVGGEYQPMGDLDFRHDAAAQEWFAEFQNARVHIRWSFTLQGDGLTGTIVDLPGHRVVRNLRAKRLPAR